MATVDNFQEYRSRGAHGFSELALSVLPEDVRTMVKSMESIKQTFASMSMQLKTLMAEKELLEKDLEEARLRETSEHHTVLHISKELNKLQISYTSIVDIKEENVKLAQRVRDCEKEISELSRTLQEERASSASIIKNTCLEYTEKDREDLEMAKSEISRLRDQLCLCQEQLRITTSEFQSELRSVEVSKRDESRQSSVKFQDKIDHLQSELQATRAHCRSLQEKLRTDTAEFQKKIKELEKSSGSNIFARAKPGASKIMTNAPKKKQVGGRLLPSLDFVNSDPNKDGASDDQETVPAPAHPKKRKLFVQRTDYEDD